MKSINKIIFGAAGLFIAGIALVSCTKSFDSRLVATYGNESSSNVQLLIATVGASRNYLVVDNKPVNGAALHQGSICADHGHDVRLPTG